MSANERRQDIGSGASAPTPTVFLSAPDTATPDRRRDFPADVDVAIVCHNSIAVLPAALTSLVEARCPPGRITVIDIASTDGTGDWLAREWPTVHLRRLTTNAGPNPGRNVGITESSRPFVLLMDADVRVGRDAIHALHAVMAADRSIKIGCPLVVYASRPDVIQYGGGAIHYICEAVNRWRDRPVSERGTAVHDIGTAPGCALLLDRQASIDIGLFDERYFAGKEDGDFVHRMNIAGHRVVEVPQAIASHESRPRGSWLFYYQVRNRWHFILKNYQLATIVGLIPPLLIYEPMLMVVLIAKGHGGTYFRALGGLIAMLGDLPRDRALQRRIRRRADRDLLVSAQLIVRDDLATSALVRHGKNVYERFLDTYWRLLHRVLPRTPGPAAR